MRAVVSAATLTRASARVRPRIVRERLRSSAVIVRVRTLNVPVAASWRAAGGRGFASSAVPDTTSVPLAIHAAIPAAITPASRYRPFMSIYSAALGRLASVPPSAIAIRLSPWVFRKSRWAPRQLRP